MSSLKDLVEKVSEELRPTKEEIDKALEMFDEVSGIIKRNLRIEENFKVELEGSVAKGTAIKNDLDLDIFLLIRKKDMNNKWIKEHIISPLYSTLSKRYSVSLRFASHPYIRVKNNGIEADVVPAYWAKDLKEIRTPVDRTPFHTRYVRSKLRDEKSKDNVRLLKKFFKSLNVYGAEIKVEGFSGFVSELLIIKYKSFIETLRNISRWKYGTIVVIERPKEEKILEEVFKGSPLIIPDPVDPRRNAAAAVSRRSLTIAVIGASSFLRCPSKIFFYPKRQSFTLDKLDSLLKASDRVAALLVYKVEGPKSPDIIWGEVKKLSRKLKNVVFDAGFPNVDISTWSDEEKVACVLIETLIPERLPRYMLREGPKVLEEKHIQRFITKYSSTKDTIGPWIDSEGKIKVLVKRKHINLCGFLKDTPKALFESKDLRLATILCKLKELEGRIAWLKNNKDFTYWLTEAVAKRPSWLGVCTSLEGSK